MTALTIGLVALSGAWVPLDWIEPGATAPVELIERVGPAAADYDSTVIEGRLDPFVRDRSRQDLRALGQRARAQGRQLQRVRVLEWETPGQSRVRVVFVDDVMWYAVVPVRGELRLSHIQNTLRGKPESVSIERRRGDLIRRTRLLIFRAEGYAFLMEGARVTTVIRFGPAPTGDSGG